MALLPIMYKMGVGTTLLGVLVFIGLKTLFMTSILFVLAISSFAKHKLSALHHQPYYYHHAPPPAPHKEVHVHVHADPHKQAYGGWHRYGSPVIHHGSEATHQQAYPHPSYHSGPPSDEVYYESEHPAYYHRRVGLGPHGLPHAPFVSRWEPPAPAADPAYYTGSYN